MAQAAIQQLDIFKPASIFKSTTSLVHLNYKPNFFKQHQQQPNHLQHATLSIRAAAARKPVKKPQAPKINKGKQPPQINNIRLMTVNSEEVISTRDFEMEGTENNQQRRNSPEVADQY